MSFWEKWESQHFIRSHRQPAISAVQGDCETVYTSVHNTQEMAAMNRSRATFHNRFMSSSLKSHKNTRCTLILIVIIKACHNFARAVTAELSWHVQNCDLIESLFFKQELHGLCEIWIISSFTLSEMGTRPPGSQIRELMATRGFCHQYSRCEIRAWISNYIHCFLWHVITNAFLGVNDDFTKWRQLGTYFIGYCFYGM